MSENNILFTAIISIIKILSVSIVASAIAEAIKPNSRFQLVYYFAFGAVILMTIG